MPGIGHESCVSGAMSSESLEPKAIKGSDLAIRAKLVQINSDPVHAETFQRFATAIDADLGLIGENGNLVDLEQSGDLSSEDITVLLKKGVINPFWGGKAFMLYYVRDSYRRQLVRGSVDDPWQTTWPPLPEANQ